MNTRVGDKDRVRCLVLFDATVRDGPYGIDELPAFGYDLVEAPPARGRLHKKVRDVVEHRSGTPTDKTVRSVIKAYQSDLVLAFLESQALLASAWKQKGLPPYADRPLGMIACWLADELRSLPSDARKRLVDRYRGVDLTMVFSANQLDVLVDAGFPAEGVASIPFGFAPAQFPFTPAPSRDVPVVAIGFDRGRDYATLIEAVRGTDLVLDLYCKDGNIAGLDLPPNVRFHGTVPFDEYRRVIARAQIIAVPTREMAYPSGQTVALEAAASGACLITTHTPALSEYFSDLTSLRCPVGDTAAWRSALQLAASDPSLRSRMGEAASKDVHARFTYRHTWAAVHHHFQARGWTSVSQAPPGRP